MDTGIVRKIDDLGRIVLPAETRRLFSIHEGDQLVGPPLLEFPISRGTTSVPGVSPLLDLGEVLPGQDLCRVALAIRRIDVRRRQRKHALSRFLFMPR